MKWVYLTVGVLVLGMMLGGCSSLKQDQYATYAECALPVTRDVGMGIRVNGCQMWEFKPTLKQRQTWEARHATVR